MSLIKLILLEIYSRIKLEYDKSSNPDKNLDTTQKEYRNLGYLCFISATVITSILFVAQPYFIVYINFTQKYQLFSYKIAQVSVILFISLMVLGILLLLWRSCSNSSIAFVIYFGKKTTSNKDCKTILYSYFNKLNSSTDSKHKNRLSIVKEICPNIYSIYSFKNI